MAKKIEKLIYTNERGESITFSHASIFHTNEVSGLSDVRNEIYSINSMGQDGDTYLGNRIQSREIEIVGSIRERDKDRMRDYPETAGIVVNVVEGLYYSYKGAVYLAKADMPNCVYPPDTAGLWQWEKV